MAHYDNDHTRDFEGVDISNGRRITVSGRHLLCGSKRFIVRGVVYQPQERHRHPPITAVQPRDPLRDERLDDLKRDIVVLCELGINALFVYNHEADQPHDRCMQELLQAGIYVIANLSDARNAINRFDPRGSYDTNLVAHFCAKIDSLAKYPNVLGVCAANQVVNNQKFEDCFTVIRALIRDVKIHMCMMHETKGQRVLPICVNDSTFASKSPRTLEYWTAHKQPDSSIDFYMFSNYDNPDKIDGTWNQICSRFSDASVPIVISEYGYNVVRPRPFREVDMLYSPQFVDVFSGGFVYDFEESANCYGLVTIKEDGRIRRLPDFYSLKAKFGANTVSDVSTP